MEIQIINCFCTDKANTGNPAAVIKHFMGIREEKQKLAKKLGMPVTVFLSKAHDEDYVLEFFYPNTEMPLCLHGTLGAAYALFKNKTFKEINCITKNGDKLLVRKEGDIFQIHVSNKQIPEVSLNKNDIVKMLNLKNSDQIENELPLEISSVGSPKLLVPLKFFEFLADLKPDFDLITEWSLQNKVNGLYVYTTDSQSSAHDFYARGFNPRTGYNEDAATGVAAAALSLSLGRSINVGQGIFTNRSSEINISYNNPESVWVGGRAMYISALN